MFESSQDALFQIRNALDFAPNWIVALIILSLSAAFALGLHTLVMRLLHRFLGQRPFAQSVLTAVHGPTRIALTVLGLSIGLPTAPLDPAASAIFVKLLALAIIGMLGWAAITALNTAATLYLLRFA